MKKLFTEKQVGIAAVMAGPVAGGLLIYKNYIALNKDGHAYKTIAVTLLFALLLVYSIVLIPSAIMEKIPSALFTGFYGLLVYLFFRYKLKQEVDAALEDGKEKGSNWTVFGFSVIGLIINVAILMSVAVYQPYYSDEVRIVDGNELYYDMECVPQSAIDKLEYQFKEFDFFGKGYGNIARIELIDNQYWITMVVSEEFWTDIQLMGSLKILKSIMQGEYGKTVVLQLESVSLSGKTKYHTID